MTVHNRAAEARPVFGAAEMRRERVRKDLEFQGDYPAALSEMGLHPRRAKLDCCAGDSDGSSGPALVA